MAGNGMVADLYAVLGLRADEGAWKKGNELVDGMKHSLEAFIGFEVVKHIAEAVKGTIEFGAHLDDLRHQTGLTAESLQTWGYAASVSGSSTDGMAHSLGHLARTMKEAHEGGEEAAKSLTQIGLTGTDISNALKSGEGLDAALLKIAEKFKNMPDGANKSALAMGVFGRQGRELIPLLDKGAEGLKELREEAIASGAVMSGEAVDGAKELDDQLRKVHMSVVGLKNQAVVALMPAITELVAGFREWVNTNRGLIIETITHAVNALITALKFLADVGSIVADMIQFMSEHTTVARSLFIALGIVITAFAAEAAAAWLVGFAPVVAVVAALALLIGIVEQLMEALLDGTGVFMGMGRAIKELFVGIIKAVETLFIGLGNFFKSIAVAIKNAFWAVVDWVTGKIDWAWEQLTKVAHFATHPWELAGVGAANGDGSAVVATPTSYVQPGVRGNDVSPVRVDAGDTNITIHAESANATEIGEIVDDKIKAHHDKVWRDTHAAGGGADDSD